MKTKNIFLPAIALLAGTLLITPTLAQELDYHELDNIKQEVTNTVTNTVKNSVPQTTYLNAEQLFNQIKEDLPIDYEELLESALNSIIDNQVSDIDQYELMAFAIETNHNKVLETLLEAGFKANIDVKLNETETKVAPFAEIAQAFQNNEALDLLNEYPKQIKIKKQPQGEYMYRYKTPVATKTIKVEPNEPKEGIIGAYYYNEHGTLVIKNFNKPLTEQEYQKWLQEGESMRKISKTPEVSDLQHKIDSIKKSK